MWDFGSDEIGIVCTYSNMFLALFFVMLLCGVFSFKDPCI